MRVNLALLLGVAPLASATNMIKFINHCPYDIWFWTVGPAESKILGTDQDRNMVPGNGGSVIHNMVDTEKAGGGISLKMRDYPYYQVAPAGIIQVEYHYQPSSSAIWYDLSAIDCNHSVGPDSPSHCPLISGGVKIYVPVKPEGHCPPAYCSKKECWNTYMQQGGFKDEPTFSCGTGSDIFVETCTENAGQQTFYGQGLNSPRVVSPPALVIVHEPVHEQPAPPPSLPPAPPPSQIFPASPNGECGAEKGYTCSGSAHGMCCSQWGFCGNTLDHCLPDCNRAFGHCLLEGGGNNSTDVSGTSPAATTTATATATATVTKSVTRTHTSTKTQPGALETVTMWLDHTVHGSCSPAPRPFSTVILPATPNVTATVTKSVILTHTSIERHLYTTASLTKTLERTVYPAWCPATPVEGALRTATVSLNHTVYQSCQPSSTSVSGAAPTITTPPTVTLTHTSIERHLYTTASLTRTIERTVYPAWCPAVALEGALPTATVSLNHTVYESCRPSATGVQDTKPAVTAAPTVTETRVLTKTHLSTVAVLTKTLQRTIYQSCRSKAFEA